MNMKQYESLDEFVNEFTRNFEYVPEEISSLWHSIIDYSEICQEAGAEGNSGEFHDDNEEKRIEVERQEKEKLLIEKFSIITGYFPVFVENKPNLLYITDTRYPNGVRPVYYMGAWKFLKVIN